MLGSLFVGSAAPFVAIGLLEDASGLERFLASMVVLVLGLGLSRLASAGLGRIAAGRSRQASLVTRRVVFTLGGLFTMMSALRVAGVELGVLLGTAGILTIAIGFASQTSASNLISGVFLLFERPFVVGDIIQVAGRTGEVLSVDMMSVKLRTFDNLFVRIPNETLLKSEIANNSHFPIRRIEVRLLVSYGEDMGAFREALFQVAADNPYVLDEPTPLVIVQEFLESAVAVQYTVWTTRENQVATKTSLFDAVQQELYRSRFEPPHPVRRLVDSRMGGPLSMVHPPASQAVAAPAAGAADAGSAVPSEVADSDAPPFDDRG